MIEERKEEYLPPCWRDDEIHPDLIELGKPFKDTQTCKFRVRRDIPWADSTRVTFSCVNPQALVVEKGFGNIRLTATTDPATFCVPYDLYLRTMGEESRLVIDGEVIQPPQMLPEGKQNRYKP